MPSKIEKVRLNCEQCGKDMFWIPGRLNLSRHHFCDIACKALWQKSPLNDYKEKVKETLKRRHKNGEITVHNKIERILVNCLNCGKEKKIKGIGLGKFCNNLCHYEYVKKNKLRCNDKNANWRGGKSFEVYPEDFFVIRKSILERDNNICWICGNKATDVHHIDYNKKNNKHFNLISLCHSCHMKTNGKREYWSFVLKDIQCMCMKYDNNQYSINEQEKVKYIGSFHKNKKEIDRKEINYGNTST